MIFVTPEEREVAKANESFYRAFERLDIKSMERVWSRRDSIQCGHPGWCILRGWQPVMESWRQIFQNTQTIRFILTDVSVEIRGDFAWVTLYENISSAVEGQNVAVTVLTTNIFENHGEGWLMIHHHGSSVAQPMPDESTPVVH